MNYIVVYRQQGEPKMEFFKYRDESDVAYKRSTLIRNEDDVIDIMRKYYQPDDDIFVIRETLLNVDDFSDAETYSLFFSGRTYYHVIIQNSIF